jgi:hypothetical protein
MEPELEQEALAAVISTLEESTGSRPRGWLGPAQRRQRLRRRRA